MKNQNVIRTSMAAVGTAVLLSSMSFAQASSSNGGMSQGAANDPMAGAAGAKETAGGQVGMDKKFVRTALAGGMFEIQAGQLASQKGSTEGVKNFGQKMVDDHTKMGDDLKPVAQKLGVPVPTHLMPKDQATYTKLQGMSGTDFDSAYVKAMLKDHKKDAAEFKAESANAADPDVKQLATKGEPIVSQHLQMLQDMAKSGGSMGSMSGGSMGTK